MEGMTVDEINEELRKGAKFVIYQYCISCVVMTFKRSSDIFFIKSGESSLKEGILYTLGSLLLGWWGIPWGPIYTIGAVCKNLSGGEDVTSQVISQMNS